jgi:hypothetical protein
VWLPALDIREKLKKNWVNSLEKFQPISGKWVEKLENLSNEQFSRNKQKQFFWISLFSAFFGWTSMDFSEISNHINKIIP